MTILWWPAIVAGVSGTLAMILTLEALRRVGWTRLAWGSLIGTLLDSPRAERWGFLIHFLDGAIAGLLYAAAFFAFDLRPGIWVGVFCGIVHGGLALLVLDVMKRRQGLVSGPFDPMEGNRGRLAIALGYVVFGAVTAGVYGFLSSRGSGAVTLGVLSVVTVLAAAAFSWLLRHERLSPSFTASSPEPRGRRSKRP